MRPRHGTHFGIIPTCLRCIGLAMPTLREDGTGPVRQLISVLALAAALLVQSQTTALAIDVVPSGNRNAEQPQIPGASTRRTKAGKTSFDAK